MIENARKIQDVERILQLGVKAVIEDLKQQVPSTGGSKTWVRYRDEKSPVRVRYT